MGWPSIVVIWPLLPVMPAGGLFYTAGAVFFLIDRRIPQRRGIRHLFVLSGSAARFVTIIRNVL